MSIRLRLTLLYSAILAVTLLAFSTILYVTQAHFTNETIQANLERQAQEIAFRERRFTRHPGDTGSPAIIPGRWTQTLGPDGTIMARTPDLGDSSLPLSTDGLKAVQNGTAWSEVAEVQSEPLLILSEPVMNQNSVVEIVQVASPIRERDVSLGILRLILIIGSGLVLILAFVAGWLLSGAALRPINRITQTAQAIGADRNFSQRVQHTGPNDEIGKLAATFNNMLTEIESAFHQIQQTLNTQRRFVADASHELRTPLTTIRGNIELLTHNPPIDPKEQPAILADTKEEAERLIRLVNQLLLLARQDAGRPVHNEPLPVQPLIEDICRQSRLLASGRTISCAPSTNAVALGDRDALKQVLLILLDNAIVHTPPTASIDVGATVMNGNVNVQVRDTGPGIAPEQQSHIFERFYRGEVSRSGPGTGLGLSIAQELMRAQNGDLSVDSQLGKGSVFTATLPRAPDQKAP